MFTLRLKALICSPRGNFPIGSTYTCGELEAKQLIDGGYAELLGYARSEKTVEKKEIETSKIEVIETTDEEFPALENTSIEIKKKSKTAKSKD